MKKALQKLKPFFFCLVLAFMVYGLWALRGKLAAALANADWLLLSASALVALIYLVVNASVWGLVSRIVGATPNRLRAAALWIECEAMRWLPGGIWGYASRVVEAKRIGLNKTNGGLSLALELIITVAGWGLLGLIGALISPGLRNVALIYLERIQVPPIALIIVVALASITALIVLLKDTLGVRTKLLKATTDLRRGLLQWQISARALAEYLLLSVFYGLGFWLCIHAIGTDPAPSFLEATSAYGIAWIVGFFAFGAPGGMGVREGFLYLVFEPLGIGAEVATAAILWRAIQIIIELLLLMIIKIGKLAPAPVEHAS